MIDPASLDRYITGNYGEDQLRDEEREEQADICCGCGGSTAEALFRFICDECRKVYSTEETEETYGDTGNYERSA